MQRNHHHLIPRLAALGLAAFALIGIGITLAASGAARPTVLPNDWAAYMNGGAHQSYNNADSAINPSTAGSLRPIWVTDTHAVIDSAPAVADGALYIGNWINGVNFFKIDANTGQTIWGADLDYRGNQSGCDPPAAGVSSGPAIYSNTVYVGGGGNWFYALNTADGSTRWRFNTAFRNDNIYNGTYNWSSPMVYSNSVYVGVASFGDCPLVQGRLLKLDANSGNLQGQFKVVPDGQIGGGIWNSPSVETATNSILVTTGNESYTGTIHDQPFSVSVLKFDATDVSTPTTHWQIPDADNVYDSDWGATLDLFSKNGHNYAATVNKNGKLYIFDTAMLASGPLTRTQIANPSGCPQCGYGDLSSPAFYNGNLYVAGPKTVLNSVNVGGTIGAVNPPTYTNFTWRKATALDFYRGTGLDGCEPDQQPSSCPRTAGMVLAPVAGEGGVIENSSAWEAQLRDASDGSLLYTAKVVTNTTLGYNTIYGGTAFGEGKMFVPSTTGRVFAFAPGNTRSDQFGFPTLGDHWYITNNQPANYSLSNGYLHVTTSTSGTLGFAPNFFGQWPLGGDAAAWTITTSLAFTPTANYQQAGLAAYQDAATNISFARVYSGGNYLLFSATYTGTLTNPVLIPDNPTIHPVVYLQLAKGAQQPNLSSVYTASYSYDNISWTTMPVTQSFYLGLTQAGLYADTGNAPAPPVTADFDYFLISPNNGSVGNPTPTPTSTPTNTPTRTNTPTNTSTRTNTPTNTPVNTATPTNTPTHTPTNTPLPTNTPTNTPVNTATPTNTPTSTSTDTPTNTPTNNPTMTNTPTPTDCPNPFVDINGNLFYGAIHYLYCRGVVNGIDPTHFAPNGISTRGQFAKVVVLGFGIAPYTPNTPDFTDVPPAYYAYTFIEAGFHAGILNGYDPVTCSNYHVTYPCYLPNNPITRGQITKLVVSAAHYALVTPIGGGQTYSDVPPSNVFYLYIETAHYKGVVNGYPNGTFLPNNNVQRDQMCQIVYKGVTTP